MNKYVARKMLEMLQKDLSLSLYDKRVPLKEGWLGEVLIKLHLKKRRYIYRLPENPGKILRIVKHQRTEKDG